MDPPLSRDCAEALPTKSSSVVAIDNADGIFLKLNIDRQLWDRRACIFINIC
ncbi:hypothetical protein NW855_06675 [Synechococcus sp. RC10B2]